MSAEHELAQAPASEDPSRIRTTKAASARRLTARYVSAALLLSVGCSRLAPTSTVKTPAGGAANTNTDVTGMVATTAATNGKTGTAPGVNGPGAKTPVANAPHDDVDRSEAAEAKPKEESARSDGYDKTTSDEPAAPPQQMPSSPAPSKGSAKLDSRLGLSGRGIGGGGYGTAASAAGAGVIAPTMHGAMQKRRVASASPSPTSAPLVIAQPMPAKPMPMAAEKEFNTEAYKSTPNNPFRLVTEAPLSTFSVDVDTASYSNMRRFVQEGHLPPADAIRTEEWVNYFSYDDAPPSAGGPVAVASELTECPWATGHELLRVALTTQPIAQEAVPPRNLVFLIDVSGSMEPANKLPLLKRGLAMLARQLRPVDTLSIVVYAGASGLALPPTSGAEQGKILAALQGLESGGSTNGAEGIQLAYHIAEQQMKHGGINRVLLATDGDFNVGVTSEGELTRLIEKERKTGVFLTVLGFGEGNLKDSTMESLADKGNGNYAYIDSVEEARKVLVQQAGATLVTVAQDVKLQLEFNPTHVKGYRLVGYEDRVLADQDFNDDTKDAGDMGAGHHVTAFYEIVPASAPLAVPTNAPAIDPLKYQSARQPAGASASNDLLTVKIRYKPPGGSKSFLMSRPVADHAVPLASTSESLRFGAAVAEYSLALRGAEGVGVNQLSKARSMALGALGADLRHERQEFVALMDRAATLPKN